MYGPLLSVLLVGMVPVWGIGDQEAVAPRITVAPPAPVTASSAASDPLLDLSRRLSASGVLIVDLESGQKLFGRSAEVPRPMASLTKLMTALIIVENHDLGEWVTVPENIGDAGGNVANLPPGAQFRVSDLLSALLVMSANDAAVTLARYHSGTIAEFVEAMNERAQVLGLQNTVYQNPTGMDAPGQQSTPQDLAWLAMFVMRHEDIAKRMGLSGTSIMSRAGEEIVLTHTHALLHKEQAVVAGKTGTTDQAGQCLLSVVEDDGHQYLVILLHSGNRYGDMRAILAALAA